jgi:putative colanic acid biosynthesis acetyltransferase WcaF
MKTQFPIVDLSKYDQSGYNRGKPGLYILFWWLVQETIFQWVPHPFDSWRVVLLRLFGCRVGKHVKVRPSARFYYPWRVNIGDHVWIGDGATFYSLAEIFIEDHVVISQKTFLCTGSHDVESENFGLIVQPIIIKSGAWIATDCFIAPGVKIGSNAVIGARSNVFGDMPPSMICYGTPCVPVRARKFNKP